LTGAPIIQLCQMQALSGSSRCTTRAHGPAGTLWGSEIRFGLVRGALHEDDFVLVSAELVTVIGALTPWWDEQHRARREHLCDCRSQLGQGADLVLWPREGDFEATGGPLATLTG